MSGTIDVTGLEAALLKLARLGGVANSPKIVSKMRENIADLKNATVALAPIDEGDLVRGVNSRTRTSETTVIGEVGVNAQNDGYPYPVRQHEDTTLKPGPQTALKPDYDGMSAGPKFLTRPFNKYGQKYVDNLAEGVQQAIEELS